MLHLDLEMIARLVDDAPNADEAAHLASCDACSRELDAMRQQTFALTNLGEGKLPRESWTALEKRLEREGLIARETTIASIPDVAAPPRPAHWQLDSAPMRAAAAIVIFALGGLGGAWARGARTGLAAVEQPDANPIATAPQPTSSNGISQALTTPDNPSDDPVQSSVHAASNNTTAATHETADASQDVRTAEAAYLRALARYSEQRPANATVSDPVARLATLESILLTTKAALREAPADPVINGYHITALAERDAVLKQIAMQQSNVRRQTSNNWF